ncbi:hypothetical protein BCF33_0243 [Hasllibacter halocynthiae]|uniref:Uncharacterized protein n=1 Tax=Hasllibacter halocynthiae TaxID=595589 RepID=A0A2T0X6T6_9RHOB|nr:hypothetical protein [Hasllibacter halocynthiae]PRY94649.1 hypothetical protein BCF33_0243 [Hasllibacter halocynthiae]
MADEYITPRAVAESTLDRGGRSAWGAIFAGTAVALALFLALLLLGLSLGFVNIDPNQPDPLNTHFVGAGIYLFVAQLVALGAGGYVAGRLAGVLHTIGSALHGATVWALTTLVAAWLATTAASGLFSLATGAVTSAASAVSSATQAIIPDDLSLPDISASSFSFDDLPDPVQQTLRRNGLTPENFQAEAREAFRDVVSQREQRQIVQEGQAALRDAIASPGDIGRDAEQFVEGVFGRGGILGEEDRRQAVEVMQRRFGISPADAEAFVAEVQADAERLQAEAEQAVEAAKQEAIDAAAAANEALRTAGILGFIASMIGLAAAVGGAVAGRVKFIA